ncbi:PhaM family polyhydroxyalkanoate granule multifunctional regulatory protein [Eleftheria terrae]|uniref:PhaM family polyhydroxyalkanoate granule multifunctional regulatory protein n=1 Tax=Eleftheria terrae TaxID=1597781 RepID=UPI00263BC100|nr:PhaM family polyhydroxyalkanoate granule multifunctional regulatory protein [Eleftheria terrae]WKB51455.1 hypothetical protein N7L95_16805 [Eleftheria terrae]
MSDPLQGIGKLVPGFDFLQEMVKSANSAMPSFTQWIAPTLDPAELDKRISELRTVQFWLEQNARMLAATVQAMEVQRMTLSTLQTMNVPMDALRESMKVKMPSAPPTAASAASSSGAGADGQSAAAPPAAAAGLVDPMQWWGALTQQFATLAANTMNEALKDRGAASASQLMQQSFEAAQEGLRQTMAPLTEAAANAQQPAAARKPAARRGNGGKGEPDSPDAKS